MRLFSLRAALCLATGLVLAGSISLASHVILNDGPLRSPDRFTLTIPPGTAEAMAAGAPPPSIPASFTFVQGDTLVIRNEDEADHRMGDFFVPAGTTREIPLRKASSDGFLCTFHPQGKIELFVKGRASTLAMLFPTLLIGLPLGIATAVVTSVVTRLDASPGIGLRPRPLTGAGGPPRYPFPLGTKSRSVA